MGTSQILATQEYRHVYRTWKLFSGNECTWVCFKAYFKEEYLDREELKHTEGAAGYGIADNVKCREMEYSFMNFASATAARDDAFAQLTTTTGNL